MTFTCSCRAMFEPKFDWIAWALPSNLSLDATPVEFSWCEPNSQNLSPCSVPCSASGACETSTVRATRIQCLCVLVAGAFFSRVCYLPESEQSLYREPFPGHHKSAVHQTFFHIFAASRCGVWMDSSESFPVGSFHGYFLGHSYQLLLQTQLIHFSLHISPSDTRALGLKVRTYRVQKSHAAAQESSERPSLHSDDKIRTCVRTYKLPPSPLVFLINGPPHVWLANDMPPSSVFVKMRIGQVFCIFLLFGYNIP